VHPKITLYFFWAPFREGAEPKEIRHFVKMGYTPKKFADPMISIIISFEASPTTFFVKKAMYHHDNFSQSIGKFFIEDASQKLHLPLLGSPYLNELFDLIK
jgi:hypothetical protein